MKLILIRGLPGSGKSTFAEKELERLWEEGSNWGWGVHYEADMFFTDRDGTYRYRPELIAEAHVWCQKQTRNALENGDLVIVSNTFTTIKEMQPYIDMDPELTVYKCTGDYRSIHNVPQNVIDKMRDRWEDYPGEIVI